MNSEGDIKLVQEFLKDEKITKLTPEEADALFPIEKEKREKELLKLRQVSKINYRTHRPQGR